MKLYLKQKVFSFHDRFLVKDESENDRFSVKGELFSLGRKLHVSNEDGAEVALVHQKVLSLAPKFFIELCGHEECELIGELKLLRQSYRLEGTSWHLDGNFLDHEYTMTDKDDGRIVMTVAKKWFSWGDSYELEIENPEDELLCLCVVLAIDCVLDEAEESSAAAAASAAHRKTK